jgi:hypothetical protein
MYMQRTTSGATSWHHDQVHTTHNERRRGKRPVHHDQVHAWRPGHRLGTTIKHLRCTSSGAAGNGLGATMKYLRCTTSAAANNGLSTKITPPYSAAYFEVNSEPHTGALPSVRFCVGPELARCVHFTTRVCTASTFPARCSSTLSPACSAM